MEHATATEARHECFDAKALAIVGPRMHVNWRPRRRQLTLDGHFSLDELRLLIAAVEEVYGCGHEEGGCDCPH